MPSAALVSTLTGNDLKTCDVICLWACHLIFFVPTWLVGCRAAEADLPDSQPILLRSARWCHVESAGVRIISSTLCMAANTRVRYYACLGDSAQGWVRFYLLCCCLVLLHQHQPGIVCTTGKIIHTHCRCAYTATGSVVGVNMSAQPPCWTVAEDTRLCNTVCDQDQSVRVRRHHIFTVHWLRSLQWLFPLWRRQMHWGMHDILN